MVAAVSTTGAQPAPAKPADGSELRHQIYVMEGALARAVNFGAARLNQEIRAVMPDMIVLAGESNARGFQLEHYGVFFDVEVPVLRQSMMWSLRTILDQDDQASTNALASLRAFVAASNGSERAAAEASLRLLEAQLRPLGMARRANLGPGLPASESPNRTVSSSSAAAVPSAAPRRPPVDSLLLDGPQQGVYRLGGARAHRRDARLLAAHDVARAGGVPHRRRP